MQFKEELTQDIKNTAFKPNMVASSKNLYSILEKFGDEKVWSSYMLLLKCYGFKNKGQTDQGARKTQVSQM